MEKQSTKFDFTLEVKTIKADNFADFETQIKTLIRNGVEISAIVATITLRSLS